MADNLSIQTGSGGPVATDDVGGVHHQRVKIQYGTDGNATDVSDSNPLPIDDAGGSISIDDGGGDISIDDGGNVISVDDAGTTLSVDDGAGSLTVDSPGIPTSIGQKTKANSMSVTVASDDAVTATVENHIKQAYLAIGNGTPAYASGDVIGSNQYITGFSDDGIKISQVIFVDVEGGQVPEVDIFFFGTATNGTYTDNAAFDIDEEDAREMAGVVSITSSDYVETGTIALATKQDLNLFVDITDDALYFVVVSRGTPDWTNANRAYVNFTCEMMGPD
jgi:hypothetical protein